LFYNVFFCGKEGRKKSQKKATMMFCKYYVHCQLGSMIEGFGLLGVGFRGKESCPSFPTQRVCLFAIIIGLGYIGMMESFWSFYVASFFGCIFNVGGAWSKLNMWHKLLSFYNITHLTSNMSQTNTSNL
jgi:hypothetical protein